MSILLHLFWPFAGVGVLCYTKAMMKKLTLIILAILILALTACKSNSSTTTPALGSGSVYFPVYQITAPADGKILGLILEKGDRIGQEQPLFAVDDQQLAAEIKEAATDAARTEAEIKAMQNGQNRADNTAAVAAAQQQYEQAAAQEAKMASLYKQGAIARRQYEAASAAKATAQAALSAAQSAGQPVKASPETIAEKQKLLDEQQQKYHALLQKQLALEEESPCTGIVTEKYLNAGDTAAAGQEVLAIRDLENCSAVIKISAQAAQNLKVGQSITARAGSINKNFNGSIAKVEGTDVTVNIDNTSLDLKEGMEISVTVN